MRSDEFNQLVLAHKGRLFRLAKWMLRNREDAEDIVQEVFIKVWRMRDKLEEYRSIEAFMVEVTKNMCLNKIKARKVVEPEQFLEKVKSMEAGQDVRLDLAEKLERMIGIINQLPGQQQVVMQLKGVEGLETREIAKILNETDNNVRVMLSRARKVVREAYKKHYDG